MHECGGADLAVLVEGEERLVPVGCAVPKQRPVQPCGHAPAHEQQASDGAAVAERRRRALLRVLPA
jgi:hypothetical protein